MKKYILIIAFLLFVTNIYSQDNPYVTTKYVKKNNDTIIVSSIAANLTLTVENLGTSTDTIFLKTQKKDGKFNSEYFIIIKNITAHFSGTKFIIKSNRDSVKVKYYIGDININYNSNTNTDLINVPHLDKNNSFTAENNFYKIICDTFTTNEVTVANSSYWINGHDTLGYIDAGRTEIAFFNKMTIGTLLTNTTVANTFIRTNNVHSDTLTGDSPIFMNTDSAIAKWKFYAKKIFLDTGIYFKDGSGITQPYGWGMWLDGGSASILVGGSGLRLYAGFVEMENSRTHFSPYPGNHNYLGHYGAEWDSVIAKDVKTNNIIFSGNALDYPVGITTNGNSGMDIYVGHTLDFHRGVYTLYYTGTEFLSFDVTTLGRPNMRWGGTYLTSLDVNSETINSLSTFSDNTAALTGGLTAGALYKTSTGNVMIVY